MRNDFRLISPAICCFALCFLSAGPLFADDPDLAEALFNALAAWVPDNAAIYLDTPETNPAAVMLAERHGMTVVFETARMYAGCAPDLPMRRVFGVTTFELG